MNTREHRAPGGIGEKVALFLPGIVALAHGLLMMENTIDDAAITFAYAENLATLHGLVPFAGGPPVLGATNGLFVLMLALPRLLGVPVVFTAKLLGVAGFAGGCVALSRSILGLNDRYRVVALVTGLLAACSAPLAIWGVSGLENGVLMLLVVLGVDDLLRCWRDPRRPAMAGVWMALAVMVRPDAGLLVAPAVLATAAVGVLSVRHRAACLLVLVPIVAWLGMWFGAHLFFFGTPLPNSYVAKAPQLEGFAGIVGELLDLDGPGWQYVGDFLSGYGLVPVMPLALGSLLDKRTRPVLLVAGGGFVAGLLLPVLNGGDWMNEYRFMTFGLPLLYLVLGAGCVSLLESGAALLPRRWPRWAGHVVYAVVVAHLGLVPLPKMLTRAYSARGVWSTQHHEIRARAEMFEAFARRVRLGRRPVVADVDSGGHLYPRGSVFVDLGWLTSYPLARLKERRGYYREYLFHEQRPDFIHLHGAWIEGEQLDEYAEWQQLYSNLPPFEVGAELGFVADPSVVREVLRRELLVDFFAAKEPRRAIPEIVISPACREISVSPGGEIDLGITAAHVGSPGRDHLWQIVDCESGSAPEDVTPIWGRGLLDWRGVAPGEPLSGVIEWRAPRAVGQCRELRWSSGSLELTLTRIRVVTGSEASGWLDDLASMETGDLEAGLCADIAGHSCARSVSADAVPAVSPSWRDEVRRSAREALENGEPVTAGRLLVAGAQIAGTEATTGWEHFARRIAARITDEAEDLALRRMYDAAYAHLIVARRLHPGDLDSMLLLERVRPLKSEHVAFIEGTLQLQHERQSTLTGLFPHQAISLLASYVRSGRYGRAVRCLESHVCRPVFEDASGRHLAAMVYLDIGLAARAEAIDAGAVKSASWSAEMARHVTTDLGVEALLSTQVTDFEAGTFGGFEPSGKAFGQGPVAGELEGQQQLGGFSGDLFVSSFHGGDQATGTLKGPLFNVGHRWLGLLLAGGRHRGAFVRIVVEGHVVYELSGEDSEFLAPVVVDMAPWAGQRGWVEIVDDGCGPWGHILVDRITFLEGL